LLYLLASLPHLNQGGAYEQCDERDVKDAAECVGDHGRVAGRALAAACVEHAVRAIRAVACSRDSSVHSTRGKQGELPGQQVIKGHRSMLVLHTAACLALELMFVPDV
jgi:hypothetical protein